MFMVVRALTGLVALLFILGGAGLVTGFRPLSMLAVYTGISPLLGNLPIFVGIPVAALIALALAWSSNETVSKIGNFACIAVLAAALWIWAPLARAVFGMMSM